MYICDNGDDDNGDNGHQQSFTSCEKTVIIYKYFVFGLGEKIYTRNIYSADCTFTTVLFLCSSVTKRTFCCSINLGTKIHYHSVMSTMLSMQCCLDPKSRHTGYNVPLKEMTKSEITVSHWPFSKF